LCIPLLNDSTLINKTHKNAALKHEVG